MSLVDVDVPTETVPTTSSRRTFIGNALLGTGALLSGYMLFGLSPNKETRSLDALDGAASVLKKTSEDLHSNMKDYSVLVPPTNSAITLAIDTVQSALRELAAQNGFILRGDAQRDRSGASLLDRENGGVDHEQVVAECRAAIQELAEQTAGFCKCYADLKSRKTLNPVIEDLDLSARIAEVRYLAFCNVFRM